MSIYINSYLKEEDFVVYTLDDQLEVVDINEEVSRKDITKFYKFRNCFISFEEGQIKTYNFLEHKMEIIEFPIKVDDAKISDYLILDDDYVFDSLKGHQVFLDWYKGLCREHLNPCLNILNGNLGFYPPDFDMNETDEKRLIRINEYYSGK